jgi:hypothetical protein
MQIGNEKEHQKGQKKQTEKQKEITSNFFRLFINLF